MSPATTNSHGVVAAASPAAMPASGPRSGTGSTTVRYPSTGRRDDTRISATHGVSAATWRSKIVRPSTTSSRLSTPPSRVALPPARINAVTSWGCITGRGGSRQEQRFDVFLGRRGDLRARRREVHRDLGADPELAGEVQPRTDGHAGAGREDARVPDLEVVEVGAAALQVVVERMPGAMQDAVGKPELLEEADRVLH